MKNRDISVSGIGAGANPWALESLNAVVDPYISDDTKDLFRCRNIRMFEFSAENPLNGGSLLDYVDRHGKFDFVICSHTLEDLNLPEAVCSLINKIGKGGYIPVPSKYAEPTALEFGL